MDQTSPDFVELDPAQASLMLRARYAEECRVRHSAEFWFGQAERDTARLEVFITKLRESGVPAAQIDTFVYGKFDESQDTQGL